jgi:DivIVA domain-containing protein
MALVALDRQAIERRDFPIGRRGYDPAAVDAHLREVAAAFDELNRAGRPEGQSSLAVSAGRQVQGIIAAAERASADIEREAREKIQSTRDEALLDAARIREDAIAQARTLVAAVTQATSVLLERVGSMDGELASLVESLRAGATRLTGDLAAVKGNMGELYDAASVRGGALGPGGHSPAVPGGPAREIISKPPTPPAAPKPALAGPGESAGRPGQPAVGAPTGPGTQAGGDAPPPPPSAPSAAAAPGARTITSTAERSGAEGRFEGMSVEEPKPGVGTATVAPESTATATAPQARTWTTGVAEPVQEEQAPAAPAREDEGDLDGARLVALNMALNGESRADAERYLAEHFKLVDRAKLIDDVYAAIEA